MLYFFHMWDAPIRPGRKTKEPIPLLEWMETYAATPQIETQVEEAWARAKEHASRFVHLETTPQGAPWHCEGLFVSSHVKRMLGGLFAIVSGASLHDMEECSREKHLADDVARIEETIREQAATFEAFALLHDLGKQDTLSFDAAQDTRGAAEGFVQHRRRMSPEASASEKALYVKFARAFEAAHPEKTTQEMLALFFDAYGIQTHYDNHPSRVLKQEYEEDRAALERVLRLSPRDAALLVFLIANHIDAITFFDGTMDVARFELLSERAVRDGIDPDDALDALLAALLLDASLGGVSYRDGVLFGDIDPVLRFLRAEALAAPSRRETRRAEQELKKKQAFRTLLKSVGLGGEEPFRLLHIPFGRQRKGIAQEIEQLVKDPSLAIPPAFQSAEFRQRLREARERFDAVRDAWENGVL